MKLLTCQVVVDDTVKRASVPMILLFFLFSLYLRTGVPCVLNYHPCVRVRLVVSHPTPFLTPLRRLRSNKVGVSLSMTLYFNSLLSTFCLV